MVLKLVCHGILCLTSVTFVGVLLIISSQLRFNLFMNVVMSHGIKKGNEVRKILERYRNGDIFSKNLYEDDEKVYASDKSLRKFVMTGKR